jgi:hypothetical protein
LPVAVVDDYDTLTAAGLISATLSLTAAQAEARLPGPHVFAFYWLHHIETVAKGGRTTR